MLLVDRDWDSIPPFGVENNTVSYKVKPTRCLVKMYAWNIISGVFRRKQMMVSFEGDIDAELVFEYFFSITWIALFL